MQCGYHDPLWRFVNDFLRRTFSDSAGIDHTLDADTGCLTATFPAFRLTAASLEAMSPLFFLV